MKPSTFESRIPVQFFAASLAAIFLPALPLGATPSFQYIGDLPGGAERSSARGVSADGRYVVGDSSSVSSGVNGVEAFIWEATAGMTGLGDIPGGAFFSTAADVSADGNVVVGSSADGVTTTIPHFATSVAFLWTRGAGVMKSLGKLGITNATSVATSVSRDGTIVAGTVSWEATGRGGISYQESEGFRWTQVTGLVALGAFDAVTESTSNAFAISPDGQSIVGVASGNGLGPRLYRKLGSAPLEDLGRFGNFRPDPYAVANGGQMIGGSFAPGGGIVSPFVWTAQAGFRELQSGAGKISGCSANGRIAVDVSGGLYIDSEGPVDLRKTLAEAGIVDLTGLTSAEFGANAISDDGLTIVGFAVIGGIIKAWRVKLTDCDTNGLPDEIERDLQGVVAGDLVRSGTGLFDSQRDSVGFGTMIAQYGRPWDRGTGRVPSPDPSQPAEHLRALLTFPGCPDAGFASSVEAQLRYLRGAALPVLHELHAFEMLLGNEAFADALDPTIGLDGIGPDSLSGEFAFKGLRGIDDLLDEELALLRGRELPGTPSDWLSETLYYPVYTSTTGEEASCAVYNRLPPNGSGDNSAAFLSNYSVADNYEAALAFPQGHGDAYGYYLSAAKFALALFRDGPEGGPDELLATLLGLLATDDAAVEAVRDLAQAAAARAQCGLQVVDLLFRRDYRENPDDPRVVELFADPDGERAWSMGDWARRGALGSYFDWAAVAHLASTSDARPVHRANLVELEEIAGAASTFQERLDTAGAGLDPLGLVQNVVPFGIDASGLEPGSGRSHFEQVRDAAQRALDNARKAFEVANQAGARLRESDDSLDTFGEQLEDVEADFDQRLIEICGLPSPDDPADNDLNPATTDFVESQSHPDLVSFFASNETLAEQGWRPRLAPGEIQIALSELRVAALRIEQAELALDELAAQIRSQIERIELMTSIQAQRIEIIAGACDQQVALTERLEAIEERKKSSGLIGRIVGLTAQILSGDPGAAGSFFSLISEIAGEMINGIRASQEESELKNEFDVEAERQRVQCWKELQLQGLEDVQTIDAETRELKALLRRSPQLVVDRAVAVEVALQAFGRLQQAAVRAGRLVNERKRLVARADGSLAEERWRDLSFRVFRNAALKNYRGLFDIAARYVVLAARAYAYEFDARSDGDDALSGIYRERLLGDEGGFVRGLQGVLARLEAIAPASKFNRPLETLGERSFSFRRNLLGISDEEEFPIPDLRFRAWLESQIVDRLEDLTEIRDQAQVSVQRDYGPALVIPFATEIESRNFFGQGPELPFGNANFSITRNAKIRSFAIRLDGVDAALGTDPQSGTVFVYLLPVGDSVLRENTNRPVIEDELATPWAVVDQYLPVPSLAQAPDLTKRRYNPWRSGAQSGGNFLGAIKRHRDSEAQIELGQPLRLNTNLAGRSAWNTRWLLVIPGSQWTSSSDPFEIRRKLRQFIYGTTADPAAERGINDIRLIIQAYSH